MTRQVIRETIETLEVTDELASESELTGSDVQELADTVISDAGYETIWESVTRE